MDLSLTEPQEMLRSAARTFIERERSEGKDPEAIIAADASVRHGRVVGLIDLIKTEGVVKFAINTDAKTGLDAAQDFRDMQRRAGTFEYVKGHVHL